MSRATLGVLLLIDMLASGAACSRHAEPAATADRAGPTLRDASERGSAESPSVDPSSVESPSPAQPVTARPSADPPAPAAPALPACVVDTDCALDDPCVASRCELGGRGADPNAECSERAPAPGVCRCISTPDGNACALERTLALETPTGCERDHCGLDLAGGRCLVGEGLEHNQNPGSTSGPICDCKGDRCELHWASPVHCDSAADCWFSDTDPTYPIARPSSQRRDFRQCRDGDYIPVCRAGTCELAPTRC